MRKRKLTLYSQKAQCSQISSVKLQKPQVSNAGLNGTVCGLHVLFKGIAVTKNMAFLVLLHVRLSETVNQGHSTMRSSITSEDTTESSGSCLLPWVIREMLLFCWLFPRLRHVWYKHLHGLIMTKCRQHWFSSAWWSPWVHFPLHQQSSSLSGQYVYDEHLLNWDDSFQRTFWILEKCQYV